VPLVARRTVLLATALALVALVLTDRAAHGAAAGPLVVTIEGSLGEPTRAGDLVVAPAVGVQRFSGLLEGAAEGDGVLVAFEPGDVRRPLVIGMLWSSHESPPESIACTGLVCSLQGPVAGVGRLELAEVDPVPGGRVSLRIVVRRAVCERCP
jgi:hypothetical protein